MPREHLKNTCRILLAGALCLLYFTPEAMQATCSAWMWIPRSLQVPSFKTENFQRPFFVISASSAFLAFCSKTGSLPGGTFCCCCS